MDIGAALQRAWWQPRITLLAALLWFEALFGKWRKLPFTCSYVPGKRPVWLTIILYSLATPLLAAVGKLIVRCSDVVMGFAALFTFLAVPKEKE